MDKKVHPFPKTLAATKTDSILAVISGLPVDANGHYLSDAQMTNIEAALSAGEKAATDHTAAQASLKTLQDEKTAVDAKLVTANERIATLEKEDGKEATTPAAAAETKHATVVDANAMDFQKDLLDKL